MILSERLEQRIFLDGDVSASFVNGNLTVRGDDGDNVVRISQQSPGVIRVAGLDDTAVNGEESVDFSGNLNHVRVLMRQGGEDTVEIQGPLQIGGNVVSRLGAGEFIIEGTLGPVEIAGLANPLGGEDGGVRFRNEVVVNGRAVANGNAAVVTAFSTPGVIPDFDAASFSDPLNIDNPYHPLVPGTIYTHEETETDDETGETEVTVVTNEVTNDTRTILGVQVRVVHAVESVEGLVVEDTFDWFAQDDNGNVWYFGEDTTSFEYDDEGNLIEQSDAGSFEAGMDGAQAGIIMLANPQPGDAYFEEVLLGEAIDQAVVLANDETVTFDLLGTSSNVLRTENSTALEPDALEQKLYVPGFGLAQEIKLDPLTGEEEGIVELVSATLNGQDVTQVVSPDNFQGTNATGARTVAPMRFLGDVSFTAGEEVIMRNVQFENNAYARSDGDIVLLDSVLSDEPAFVSQGAVGLRGLTVTKETFVRAGDEVVIRDSEFQDALFLRFTTAQATASAGDSSFTALNIDGRGSDNTFEDLGGNTFSDELILKGFEIEEENGDGDEDEEEEEDEEE